MLCGSLPGGWFAFLRGIRLREDGKFDEEKTLEALFKRYLNMNAQEHWPILKSVIADLRVELDISTKPKA